MLLHEVIEGFQSITRRLHMCVIWGRAEGLVWPAIAFHRARPGAPYQQWEERAVEGHLGLEGLAECRAAEVIGAGTVALGLRWHS